MTPQFDSNNPSGAPLEHSIQLRVHYSCWLVLALLLASVPLRAATPRPNVVVILTDDQGWGDLSLNGNTNLQTPQIDSLARDGAMFERFFVSPVCAPTRAEFFTGRYHTRGGVRGVTSGSERLNLDERTIAEAFRAAGYATGAFGKWHNGSQWPYHPNARGFDEFYGFTSGHWGQYFDSPLEYNGELVKGRGYIADDITDRALAFIEQNKERPFFCYLPLPTPHSPFMVPDEYWNRFKDAELQMRHQNPQQEQIDSTRCALAMCENIDWNVGRVLQRLEQLRLAENTIVIYFSDNGPNTWRWNGGMKGRKGSTDEGGVRVPFLIRWPGHITPGTKVSRIAGAIDILPTLVALTGIPRVGDKPLDGKDLTPLLTARDAKWPDRKLFTHQNGKVSVRTQRYRLDSNGTLYDMGTDPGQRENIAAKEPAIAAELMHAVADWKRDTLPKSKDSRPFTVGYRDFPRTWLPARDGIPHEGIARSGSAPNCSYFTRWTNPGQSMTWDIEVATAGEYEVTLYYTCGKDDAGSTVELSFGDAKVTGRVEPPFDPPLWDKQDRVPRVLESYIKEFAPLQLGTFHIAVGRGTLSLRALQVTGKSVMDMRAVMLKLR